MLRALTLFLLFSSLLSLKLIGQKNHRYLDLHGNIITKTSIQEQDDPATNIIGVRKVGKIKEHRLFPRQHQGKLDTISLANLLNQFDKKTGDGPQTDGRNSDIILINYYPGADRCNTSGIATPQSIGQGYKRFLRKLKREDNISVFNIYKDDKRLERWSQNRTWYEDQDQLLENLFFNYHFACSSYVIIDQTGNYIVYYGESIWEQRLANIRELQNLSE